MPRHTSPSVSLVAARYELVRELGTDSETSQWEGFDTRLDRSVVVQLLRPELTHDAAATERFWQLARAAARRTAAVGNRVLDGGTDAATGQVFVVREWPSAPPPSPPDSRRRVAPPPSDLLLAQLLGRFAGSPRWWLVGGCAIVLMLALAAVKPGVEGWLAWVNEPLGRSDRGFGLGPTIAVPASGAQPGQSTATPAPAPPTVVPAARSAPPAATPSPTPGASSTPSAAGQTRTIVNTDGRGVALRATPGGDRLPAKGYDEGATVQAFERSGEWTHIRGSDGREGWVLTVTLAP